LQKILSHWYLSALIILFALRELDYDKAHFTHGVLKSRQYFSDLVGLPELLISLAVLIFILTVLLLIVLRERNNFIKGVIDLRQSQLAVLASIILVIVTKTIDGMERKFGLIYHHQEKDLLSLLKRLARWVSLLCSLLPYYRGGTKTRLKSHFIT
jgi:hypothetical protein